MHLLGFVLDLDGPGAATATIVVGVTAEAELKSLDGLAAKVKRGKGQLMLVYITVCLYHKVITERVGMAAAPHKTKTLQILNFFLKPFLHPVASAATCLQLSMYISFICLDMGKHMPRFVCS